MPDDVPFEGARAIDLSAPPRNALPRRSPAYGPASASNAQGMGNGLGGPRTQRMPLRRPESGALRRLAETGAMRRLRETGAMRVIMDTAAMRVLMDTTAMQILRDRYAGRGKMVATVGIAIWVVVAVVAIALVLQRSGGGTATATSTGSASARAGTPGNRAASTAATNGADGQRPAARPPAGRKPTSAPSTAPPSQALAVVKAEAFGSQGLSDGDNPQKAALVLAGHGTPWQTNWYGTSHFGGLKPGTGLVLDMGKTVTVAKVTLQLTAGSAGVIVRVGNTPVPGTFTLLEERTGIGGSVTFQAAKPLTGRYVEIWFTALPRDGAGTYQESVYGVMVAGQP